jgi:hypothetical protein
LIHCYSSSVRIRLQYGLPLAQFALAVALTMCAAPFERKEVGMCDSPGPNPALKLLDSLNAPVALFDKVYQWWLSGNFSRDTYGDRASYVVHIAPPAVILLLFWYWVALNIIGWRERRRVLLFQSVPLRVCADGFFIAEGLLWGIYGLGDFFRHYPGYLSGGCYGSLSPPFYCLSTALALVWCTMLIYLFGGDLRTLLFPGISRGVTS